MNAPLQDLDLAAASDAYALLEIPLVSAEHADGASGECILQIINDLRNLYQQRNFSHVERFGSPDPMSETVLRDLGNAYDSTVLWMHQAQDGNSPPRLASSIKVKLLTQ